MTSRIIKWTRRGMDDRRFDDLVLERRRRQAAEEALRDLRRRYAALEAHAQTLQHLASHDPLTGLPNRRELEERLSAAFAAARRHGHALAVCLLDLDGFKQVNDRLGHAAGDRVLAHVAKTLRETLRAEDVPGRLGGDEFCLVFPHTTAEEALPVVERVRARLSLAPPAPVTATFGLAGLRPEQGSPQELLEAADLALYRAKHGGKNQTAVYQRPRRLRRLRDEA